MPTILTRRVLQSPPQTPRSGAYDQRSRSRSHSEMSSLRKRLWIMISPTNQKAWIQALPRLAEAILPTPGTEQTHAPSLRAGRQAPPIWVLARPSLARLGGVL